MYRWKWSEYHSRAHRCGHWLVRETFVITQRAGFLALVVGQYRQRDRRQVQTVTRNYTAILPQPFWSQQPLPRFVPCLHSMDLSLAVCPQWPGPSGRQPAGSTFRWVGLAILCMLACSLAELFRLYRWLFRTRIKTNDKAVQVDLPACNLETVMTMTIEAIREELAGFQASKAGTKETLAERLCEFRKRAMLQ